MKKALVRNSDNVVVNVVTIDPNIPAPGKGEVDKRYKPPSGHRLVNVKAGAQKGNQYSNGEFTETQVQRDERAAKEAERRAKRPAAIKAEAYRRIVAIIPEWKQRNLTAEGVELLSKLADGQTLTAQEQTARTKNLAMWAQVKAIRTKSNELEAMDPVPDDFTDDKYWT